MSVRGRLATHGAAIAILAAASASACGGGDVTELFVVVQSDLVPAAELDRVEILVEPEGRDAGAQRVGRSLDREAELLPASLSIVEDGARGGAVLVTATASLGEREVVSQRARVSFVPGRSRVLSLELLRCCVGTSCGAGQSCRRGRCSDVDRTSEALPPFTPALPPLERCDTDAPLDGGPDAAIDAGRDGGGALDAGPEGTDEGGPGRDAAGRDLGPAPDAGPCSPFDGPDAGPGSVVQITAGGGHACARTRDGGLYCWGRNGAYQLGLADTAPRAEATPTGFGRGAASDVSAGALHTCAALSFGAVNCWGSTHDGRLGTDRDALPGSVDLLMPATQVSAGEASTCARRAARQASCWGANTHGQLGDGTTETRWTPVDVLDLVDVRSVQTGTEHTCALRESGEVACWGWRLYLGSDAAGDAHRPVAVPGLDDVVELRVSGTWSCARRSGGDVACWTRGAPEPVPFLADAVSLSVGASRACAVTARGTVACWQDEVGTLSVPAEVAGLCDMTSVAVGAAHQCALDVAGAVWCWGRGTDGQLGNGAFADSSVPVRVVGLP